MAKSKQITGEKNIYAEKQGPKIKSGSKKYDYPKDKTRILTDTVKVYKKISGLTEGDFGYVMNYNRNLQKKNL